MESLRPLDDLCAPDPRQNFFAALDRESGHFRKLRIEDVYGDAAAIQLHEGVPEAVRSHFATALNLLAYSWYFYPFNVTAQLMGYVSVEFALRALYPNKPNAPFKRLVEHAIAEGLIQDSGFSVVQPKSPVPISPELEPTPSEPSATAYSKVLTETMPYLRNTLAHGTSLLHNDGVSHVRTCAEFINQLFPRPNGG